MAKALTTAGLGLGLPPSALITLGLGSFAEGLSPVATPGRATTVARVGGAHRHWLLATASTDIPGFSLVKITGSLSEGDLVVFQVELLDPAEQFTAPYAAVGIWPIVAGTTGYITFDFPAIVLA